MPDEKLLAVIEEIKALLIKHDVAGMVWLASQDSTQYLHQLSPTWSCASFEPALGGIRFRAKRIDFASREEHVKCLQNTIGMLASFLDVAILAEENLNKILGLVGQSVVFDYVSRHEPPKPPQFRDDLGEEEPGDEPGGPS